MKKISSIPVIAAVYLIALSFMLSPSLSFAADNDSILIPDVKITPSTLNIKSKGKYITAHVTLPGGYSDELPPPESITLRMIIDDNETGGVIALRTARDYFGEVVVKFPRSDVQELIAENIDLYPSTVELSLHIAIDNETLYGTDNIRVIKPGKKGRKNK